MKTIVLLGVLASLLCLTACENATAISAARLANAQAEASDSAFRWKTQNVNGGTIMYLVMGNFPSGPTIADPVLKKDTLALITKAESTKGRTNPEVTDVKHLKDGGEIWILKAEKGGIAYVVHFRPSPQGGVDIELAGPKEYVRE